MERLRSESVAKSKAEHVRAQVELGKETNGKSGTTIHVDERARIVVPIDRSLEEVHTPVEEPSPPREVAPSAPKAFLGDVCHSCGAKFTDNAAFCRQCGAKRESIPRSEDAPPVARASRFEDKSSERHTSRSEDKPAGRPSRFSDGPSVTPASRYEDKPSAAHNSRFEDAPSVIPTSRSEDKPSRVRISRWSDEPSVTRSEEKPSVGRTSRFSDGPSVMPTSRSEDQPSVAPSRMEDRPSRFEDNASVAAPTSRFHDTHPALSRSGTVPPPPPPPPRSGKQQSTPPPPPPGVPPPPAATPSSTPNGVSAPPAVTPSSTPNGPLSVATPKSGGPQACAAPTGAWPSVANEQNPYASATPKSKGPEAAFPSTNVCFPPGLNFGASPPPQQASMMQSFQMPTPAMMGMTPVGLGQQLPSHVQQAWTSQQQVAAGFMPNFGSAAPSWNAFQAFQPTAQQQSAEQTIMGTTRCIRPPRANSNGHRPY